MADLPVNLLVLLLAVVGAVTVAFFAFYAVVDSVRVFWRWYGRTRFAEWTVPVARVVRMDTVVSLLKRRARRNGRDYRPRMLVVGVNRFGFGLFWIEDRGDTTSGAVQKRPDDGGAS